MHTSFFFSRLSLLFILLAVLALLPACSDDDPASPTENIPDDDPLQHVPVSSIDDAIHLATDRQHGHH